jgi:hypothetical protein
MFAWELWVVCSIARVASIPILQATGKSAVHATLYSLRVVRAIRALLVVRISSHWIAVFNSIVQATVPALNALSILIVFLVSMALVGMQVGAAVCLVHLLFFAYFVFLPV